MSNHKVYILPFPTISMEKSFKEIYSLRCGDCGKVIESLSESQVLYNMGAHKLTHKVKEEHKQTDTDITKILRQQSSEGAQR